MAALKPLLFLFSILILSSVAARQVAIVVYRTSTNRNTAGIFVAGFAFVISFLVILFIGVFILGSIFIFQR